MVSVVIGSCNHIPACVPSKAIAQLHNQFFHDNILWLANSSCLEQTGEIQTQYKWANIIHQDLQDMFGEGRKNIVFLMRNVFFFSRELMRGEETWLHLQLLLQPSQYLQMGGQRNKTLPSHLCIPLFLLPVPHIKMLFQVSVVNSKLA